MRWLWLVPILFLQDAPAKSIRVPHRVTDTNHILVRAKINDQGPYNLILDTGAPALYLSTAVGEEAGVEAGKSGWAKVAKLEIEGGIVVSDVDTRVDDPYQLIGMNTLGLPGVTLHGVIGYTVAAKFRIEFDPRLRSMQWTPLDYEVPRPPGVNELRGEDAPSGGGDMMGGLMKMIGRVFGNAAPPEPQGTIGIELDGTRVARVLPGSPADEAEIRAGDEVVRVNSRDISRASDLLRAASQISRGDEVEIQVRRGDRRIEFTLTAGEGF